MPVSPQRIITGIPSTLKREILYETCHHQCNRRYRLPDHIQPIADHRACALSRPSRRRRTGTAAGQLILVFSATSGSRCITTRASCSLLCLSSTCSCTGSFFSGTSGDVFPLKKRRLVMSSKEPARIVNIRIDGTDTCCRRNTVHETNATLRSMAG